MSNPKKAEKKRLKKAMKDAERALIIDRDRSWWLQKSHVIRAAEDSVESQFIPRQQEKKVKVKEKLTIIPVLYRDDKLVLRPFISFPPKVDPE